MMSHREIGEVLGVTEQTSRNIEKRALKKLKLLDRSWVGWQKVLLERPDDVIQFVMRVVNCAAILDKASIRAEQTAANRAVKMAFRKLVDAEELNDE